MSGHAKSKKHLWEFLFQTLLLSMVFVFYTFDRHRGKILFEIDEPEVVFFLNYAAAAYVINYALLPLFLYRKKYVQFILWVTVLIGLVIFMEEGVIEQIYFPDTRGTRFPGVLFNLMGAMPTITILAGFKFAWDALTKQRELEQLQMAVKESELQFLKSQINPHFLFNNLNNLYAYALEQSPKTPQIILELSSLMRYMLYECKEEYVQLSKELEQLENFVNLSKLQLEERGDVVFENKVEPATNRIAPLLLSVFVENAFKHSLSSQSENIQIKIHLELLEESTLKFICTNTYSTQTNTEDLTRGIGLENVKKRLNLLYPNAHQLEIKCDEGVYQVLLTLQLNQTA